MLAWFLKGSGPILLRNPIFCDFLGGGGGQDPCLPLWIRPCLDKQKFERKIVNIFLPEEDDTT